MRTCEFWREQRTGDVWAVELRDGVVHGTCGPLPHDQISPDYLEGYTYVPDLAREVEARRAEFDLLGEDALLLFAAGAD